MTNDLSKQAAKQVLGESPEVEFLHKMASSMASADPLQEVLTHIVDFAASVVSCDSTCTFCHALKAGGYSTCVSKNAHPDVVDRLKLRQGGELPGSCSRRGKPVMPVAVNVSPDPPLVFKDCRNKLGEFLSSMYYCRERVVEVVVCRIRKPRYRTQKSS